MPDYLAPFLQQLSEGTRVIQGLKQQALQQEQMKFERQQVERQNARQDRVDTNADADAIAQRMQTARVVSPGGTVMQRMLAPTSALGAAGDVPVTTQHKADPNRIVSYRSADGKSRQFELMTPDEIAQKQLEQLRATTQVKMLPDIYKQEQTNQREAANRTSREGIAAANNKSREGVSAATAASREKVAAENRASQEGISKLSRETQERIANARNQTSIQTAQTAASSRLQAAKIRGSGSGDDAQDIAEAIIRGEQSPDLKGLYGKSGAVRANLARKGYNLMEAQKDWQATQRHISTLNGPQQERYRQAIGATYDHLDQIEELYNKWSKAAPLGNSGFRTLNRAQLAIAKRLPGEAGAVAQQLDAQINDLISEMGTVYRGGNASTNQALKLAAENLRGDFNEKTFKDSIGQLRRNLSIRRNSIMNSEPAGTGGQQQQQQQGGGAPAAGTIQDGYRFKGGDPSQQANWEKVR